MEVRQFGVFAKYWQAGRVKTRLAADIGAVSASALYRSFVQTTVRRFAHVADRHLLIVSPPEQLDAFRPLLPAGWMLCPQATGDLGQRMASFFHESFVAGADRVVLIGTDSPTLPVSGIQQAFRLLADHNVVLGPADDGGYYLIGLRSDVASHLSDLFSDMAWSTSDVLARTRHRIAKAKLRESLLDAWYDVDDIATLLRLWREMQCADHERDVSSENERAGRAAIAVESLPSNWLAELSMWLQRLDDE